MATNDATNATNDATNATYDINAIHAKKVLRFEFSDAVLEQVTAFAGVHRYDDRKTYKDAWTAWLTGDAIAGLLTAEIARLKCLGYKGDVADKLFKSGRYYFRGKTQTQTNQTQTNQTNQTQTPAAKSRKPRAKYVTVSRSLLDAMDDHIERGVRSNEAYTPAIGFADFWNAHALTAEVASLFERYATATATATAATANTIANTIHAKIKKTYKNRYFRMM
jgi:hypothetical protein